jgi:hypothetical protein
MKNLQHLKTGILHHFSDRWHGTNPEMSGRIEMQPADSKASGLPGITVDRGNGQQTVLF